MAGFPRELREYVSQVERLSGSIIANNNIMKSCQIIELQRLYLRFQDSVQTLPTCYQRMGQLQAGHAGLAGWIFLLSDTLCCLTMRIS